MEEEKAKEGVGEKDGQFWCSEKAIWWKEIVEAYRVDNLRTGIFRDIL
jgi:hypothetical protein